MSGENRVRQKICMHLKGRVMYMLSDCSLKLQIPQVSADMLSQTSLAFDNVDSIEEYWSDIL